MNMLKKQLIAVTGVAVMLVGCGGGGGSSSSSSPSTPSLVSLKSTPSLGKFSTACNVDLFQSTGASLGTGAIGTDGSITTSISGSYSGPVIAKIKGSATCTYYDEAKGSGQPFAADQALYAVMPSVRANFGINILTNMAAVKLLDGDKLITGKTVADINAENTKTQMMFEVGDMFAPPILIGAASDTLDNTDAGKLGAKLAALAFLADKQGKSLTTLSQELANSNKNNQVLPFSSSDMKTAMADVVGHYAAPASKAALDIYVSLTTITTDPTKVKAEDVQKVINAGNDLKQAKQIFIDLRSSVLSIANSADDSGSLNVESQKLHSDFQNGIQISGIVSDIVLIDEVGTRIFSGDTIGYGAPGLICNRANVAMTTADCRLSVSDSKSYSMSLTKMADNKYSWEFTKVTKSGVDTALSGMTGIFDASGTTKTVVGKYYPMTGDAAYTSVNVSFTENHASFDATYTMSGSATLNSLKADNTTSTLKAEINSVSINRQAKTASLIATLTGPHHKFVGTLNFSGDVSTSSNQPRTGTMTGTFTNTADNFKFLEGTLTLTQDWTGYTPGVAVSDSNYIKYTLDFTGTAYKSAGVVGVGIKLNNVNNNYGARNHVKGELVITGQNGLQITCQGDVSQNNATWAAVNNNGLKLTFSKASPGPAGSGKVLKADGVTELGTISSDRVTFIDGTFESLI